MRELLRGNGMSDDTQQKPPVEFDLRGLVTELTAGHSLEYIGYFIGKIHQRRGDERSAKLYAGQQKLIRFLTDHQKIPVMFGDVIMHPDGSYHEKGVDIRLALDMYKMAVIDVYDIAYLFSSDNDLRPAVHECRAIGKEVIYVGSSIRPALGMVECCSRSLLVQPEVLRKYLPSSPR